MAWRQPAATTSSAVCKAPPSLDVIEPRLFLSGPASDNFSGSTWDRTLWRWVNPAGDATLAATGRAVRIAVPGGLPHDLWNGPARAPRLMQALDDTHRRFRVEVRFARVPRGRYASQGIVIQGRDGVFLRFGVHSNGRGLRVMGALIRQRRATSHANRAVVGGTPLHFRVSRDGDRWRYSYSFNGGTWYPLCRFDQALTLRGVGVFAGNAGRSPPPHVAEVDYVLNAARPALPRNGPTPDQQAPALSDVAAVASDTSVTISFSTSEPTTAVVRYGVTGDCELGAASSGPATEHQVTLDGLPSKRELYYSILARDGAGNTTTSPTYSVALPERREPKTDTFDGETLDESVWTFINPGGVGGARVDGGLAYITATAAAHDLGAPGPTAPRLVQWTDRTTLAVEAKFNSMPLAAQEMQGLLVEGDPGRFIRLSVRAVEDGVLHADLAGFDGLAPVVQAHVPVPGGIAPYLRLSRAGDLWSGSYSIDGAMWTTVASFSMPMQSASVGVFAANTGGTPRTFAAAVDHFVNLSSRVATPPSAIAPDRHAPGLFDVQAQAGPTTLDVDWLTDEPTAGRVLYGLTPECELGAVPEWAPPSVRHGLRIADLAPDTLYFLRVEATDVAGHSTASPVWTTRTADVATPLAIDVWYGRVQHFGLSGRAQRWINILGRAHAPEGLTAASFRLNGGPARPLSLGPDGRRLAHVGDFNVEIDRADLRNGVNTVAIGTWSRRGQVATVTVLAYYYPEAPAPMPRTVDWSGMDHIAQGGGVVDGLWRIDAGAVRPVEPGYDRSLALGDLTWKDYEVTVAITVHGLDLRGVVWPSNAPAVGLVFRWTGHYVWSTAQPSYGWWPVGAAAWYRWIDGGAATELCLMGNTSPLAQTPTALSLDSTYIWKMREVTQANGSVRYFVKVWNALFDEPLGWSLSGYRYNNIPAGGSILLVAQHLDASFGIVTVRPI